MSGQFPALPLLLMLLYIGQSVQPPALLLCLVGAGLRGAGSWFVGVGMAAPGSESSGCCVRLGFSPNRQLCGSLLAF